MAPRRKTSESNGMGAGIAADRLPPHDDGAEQACIGAILVSNGKCVPECQVAITPDHFYTVHRRTMYERALICFEKDRLVDQISLSQALQDAGELEAAGGHTALATCADACISVSNLPVWLESMSAKWRARRAIQIGTEMVSVVYDNPGEIDVALASADAQLMELISGQSNVSSQHSKSIAHATINEIERRHQLEGRLSGLASGYIDLDKLTNGLQRGQQTILGARPSVGKSALSGNIIEHACLRDKVPTLMISLEMSMAQFMSRMSASYSRVLAENVKTGVLTERDFAKLARFFTTVKESPLYFIDCVVKRLTSAEISAAIRIHAETHGVQLVIVDYLQLIQPRKAKAKRTDEVAEISSTLRRAAVATNTAVLAIAQLNRESEKEKVPRHPRLTDLRESGQIEQDADCVMLLHRSKGDQDSEAFLNVAKQRDGATGIVNLTFLKEYCRFESTSKVSDEDVPRSGRNPYPD